MANSATAPPLTHQHQCLWGNAYRSKHLGVVAYAKDETINFSTRLDDQWVCCSAKRASHHPPVSKPRLLESLEFRDNLEGGSLGYLRPCTGHVRESGVNS